MNDVKAALRYEAINAAGISALIASRFYAAGNVQQSPTIPYATYQVISNEQKYHQTGDAGANAARFQINCFAATTVAARAVRDAFLAEFDLFRGTMGGDGNTVTVKRAFIEMTGDLVTDPIDASARGPCGETIDLLMWFAEQ